MKLTYALDSQEVTSEPIVSTRTPQFAVAKQSSEEGLVD